MNEEAYLATKLRYGIDMSYRDAIGFYAKVVNRLPSAFAKKHNLYHLMTLYHYMSDVFKAELINNLLEYSNEQ